MPSFDRAFRVHRDRFEGPWAALWAMTPQERHRLVEHVLAFRAVREREPRDAQIGAIDAVAEDLGAARVPALGVLDYVAHVWRRTDEDAAAAIDALEVLGFLPDGPGAAAEARVFLRQFLQRIRRGPEGGGRGGHRLDAEPPAGLT